VVNFFLMLRLRALDSSDSTRTNALGDRLSWDWKFGRKRQMHTTRKSER